MKLWLRTAALAVVAAVIYLLVASSGAGADSNDQPHQNIIQADPGGEQNIIQDGPSQ